MRSLHFIFALMTFFSFQNVVLATTYAFCKGSEAFSNRELTERNPKLDYICQLKSEDQLGQATVRCPAVVKGECQEGAAGGEASEGGDHNVPSGAWFRSYSTTAGQAVKCQCGCFAPETFILNGNNRYETISDLMNRSRKALVIVATRSSADDLRKLQAGANMSVKNFTVGPESKPLVEIITAGHPKLRLTDSHPVLILKNGKQVFVRAADLALTDILVSDRGEETPVAALRTYGGALGKDVINFMSPDTNPLAHIVMANGIQVGDNVLQQIVNDKTLRANLRLSGNLTYLSDIIGK